MKVILYLNSECNIKCNHCFLPYSGARNPDEAIKIIRQLQARGHEIIIKGSEILLNPDYLQAHQEAGQKYLLTNGLLLDQNPRLYDLLKRHGIEELVFSAHFGMQKELQSVPEALVARVIKESKRRGFLIAILTLITSKNYHTLSVMCDKAMQYGADEWEPIRFVGVGRGSARQEYNLTKEQLREVFEQIKSLRKKYAKSIIEIRPEGNFGPMPGGRGEKLAKQNKYCPAGKDMVVIDPQDNIYACPFLMQPRYIIGKLENSVIDIHKEILPDKRDECIAHLLA